MTILSRIYRFLVCFEQSIDALADVYNEADGDELKLEIHRLRRYVLVSRDNNQGVICGNCTIFVLLQWMVKWDL